jgi:hypothetical protein
MHDVLEWRKGLYQRPNGGDDMSVEVGCCSLGVEIQEEREAADFEGSPGAIYRVRFELKAGSCRCSGGKREIKEKL